MNKIKRRLSKDEILRKLFLKNEIKRILLKSILKNQQVTSITRGFCSYKLQLDKIYFSRQKNFCIKTGKSGGVYTISHTSRQVLNKYLQEGFITNVKSNNTK